MDDELEPIAGVPLPLTLLAMIGVWALTQAVASEFRRVFDRRWSEGFAAGTRAARILDSAAKVDPIPVEA